jgi:hypothetical protein
VQPNRFLLEGDSLSELKARILAEHGADARIIAAERVTVGGIRGFFARRHFEVTVEVPPRRRRAAHAQPDRQARLGIAALLDDADEAEAQLHAVPHAAPKPRLSTASDGFADLMDELTFATEGAPEQVLLNPPSPATMRVIERLPPAADPVVPRPVAGVGDLVLLVGWADMALPVARAMAAANGSAEVLVAGTIDAAGLERVEDRRTALAARARGVELGHTTFVALGLTAYAASADDYAATLDPVGADQVWLVVDAGRKAADTARWAGEVAISAAIDAIAVVGLGTTASPETVDELGLPVGWIDDTPAVSTTVAGISQSIPGRANRSR